ncbi:hypothetical protein NPIL_404841 [Nephila pilipes]|nr:hypothetical protein NPIL_404841 [Nephila pilipes]
MCQFFGRCFASVFGISRRPLPAFRAQNFTAKLLQCERESALNFESIKSRESFQVFERNGRGGLSKFRRRSTKKKKASKPKEHVTDSWTASTEGISSESQCLPAGVWKGRKASCFHNSYECPKRGDGVLETVGLRCRRNCSMFPELNSMRDFSVLISRFVNRVIVDGNLLWKRRLNAVE